MTKLSASRDDASQKLVERITTGEALLEEAGNVRAEEQYEQWKLTKSRWVSFTNEVLRLLYESTDQADEFNQCFLHMVYTVSTWPEYLRDDFRDVQHSVNVLTSLQERLPLASEPSTDLPEAEPIPDPSPTGKPVVFLVHGRDIGKREEVARFLDAAGGHEYKIVILDEQATGGLTLIEKFEQHAGNTKYAVVLATGDDVGGLRGEEEQKPRPRQNVVFELGFFFGQLGRRHVAVLFEPDVEKPTDVDGVGYISLAENWQRKLVRELRNVGLEFSLDRVN